VEAKTVKILKTIAIWVITPTAILGLWYAGKYSYEWYQKYKAKRSGADPNIIGMEKYIVTIPFEYQAKYFTDSNFFDLIQDLDYSFIDEGVRGNTPELPNEIFVNIYAKPKDISKFQEIFDKENSGIKIEPIVK
jgi:hypothetical protein